MEIRQIEYVVGVVEQGGFTRAAEALHVTQPALSEGIRRLESEVGLELFHRVGRRALLSSAGGAFPEPGPPALRALRVLRASGWGLRGLTELRVAAPGVVSRQLPEQELIVVLPPGAPLAGRRRLTTADLASVPLVTSPPGTSTRGLIDAAFAVIDDAPLIAVETDQREAIVPLVVAGAGASVLPRPQAEAAALFGATTVPLSPRLVRSVGLIWRDGPVSPSARAFIEAGAAFSPRPRRTRPSRKPAVS